MKKTFIVAELSANHNNDLETTLSTLKAIKDSGADAVKLQTFFPHLMVPKLYTDEYKIKDGLWKDMYQYDLYEKINLPIEWHKIIFEKSKELGIECFSSPFDLKSVDILENLNNPYYKVASSEINHIPLLIKIAKTKKPVILSTGVASIEDISLAIKTLNDNGCDDITVLKCTASYPTPLEDSNLKAMVTIKDRFQVKVGLSDHTKGFIAPVVAVALGASFIEKHFILDKTFETPDRDFSLDPTEFKTMVDAIRDAEKSLGSREIVINKKMEKARAHMRSVYVTAKVKKGEVFTSKNLDVLRPNKGCHPKFFKNIIGTIADKDYEKYTPYLLDERSN